MVYEKLVFDHLYCTDHEPCIGLAVRDPTLTQNWAQEYLNTSLFHFSTTHLQEKSSLGSSPLF